MIPTRCHVVLPIPASQPYRYAVPRALADRVVPGARVVVPVRARELVGVVNAVDDEPADDLKPVLLAPDPTPLLPPSLLDLGNWVARYYATPLGLTFRAMLPGTLWGASRLVARLAAPGPAAGGVSAAVIEALERAGGRAAAQTLCRRLRRPVWDVLQRLERAGAVTLETEPPDLGPEPGRERILVLTRALPSLLEREQTFGRARRQRALYETVDAAGGEADTRQLADRLGFGASVVRGLVERGLARVELRVAHRDPFRELTVAPPTTPTADQRAAITAVGETEPGAGVLLFGITGSGKTLVYLEAVRALVERDAGTGAIVLVPEIALTPQTVARVRGVFGDRVAVLHSGLSEGERADAWRSVAAGERPVVVGARSAVFAPVPRLGLIVVDEEHDASYKQGEAPRYHARDVALARARLHGARVVLGSATPSLESWVARDRLRLLTLAARVGDRPLPPVRLIDLRHEPRVAAAGAVPWSVVLDRAVEGRLAGGHQVMLLLNRRGFAHYLQCPACGTVRACPSCSIALTVHRTPAALRCHYCGHQEPEPDACAACGQATQRTRGVGTQLLERWLSQRYPRARLARMDADTTSAKWSHQRLLDAFARRDIDILFGTQMIAKGLDFPGVTLVGVVDADGGLHLPDFRAAERAFQLVAQVAGRAGRGPAGGDVLVQTRSPEHPALRAAADHDYQRFATLELAARESPPYPPHTGLVNVIVSGERPHAVADAALVVAAWLRGLVAARAGGRIDVVGPAPSPLERIQRRWRWHLLLRSADRAWLGRVTRYAARRAPHAARGGAIRVVFDRDPVSLL